MKTLTLAQVRHRWHLYLLIIPALAFILAFRYFPAGSAVYHAFYDWDGDERAIFTGLANFARAFRDEKLLAGFGIVLILIFANLFKMIPSIATAVAIHRMASERARYLYRVLFVIPMIIPMMVWLLLWKFFYDPYFGPLNQILEATHLMDALQWFGGVIGSDAFEGGHPAWLGHPDLILPAFIFWGFPWVGVVSVLIYLSGLGNIDQSVYDAAEIDGCNWFRKFWNIELPLIMTQIRLNLILMVIGTLKGWGLIFILFGDSGGPEGRLMVPGLYMFRKAFRETEAGYASAIGLLLFFLIVALTWFNNRFVRVSK